MAPAVLGYWDIRGLCQPIRLMLEYCGVDYEEQRYRVEEVHKEGGVVEYDKSQWFSKKFTFDLDFPNLPYFIDGEVRLTQSNAILRHLAREHGLSGSSPLQQRRIDLLENELKDFFTKFVKFCYVDNNLEEYSVTMTTAIKQISKFLGDLPWFAGDELTFIDFLAYEILDQQLAVDADCFKDAANLRQFHRRFQELPAIKRYMASPTFIKAPIMNRMAKFGAK